ncbi:hypothetical protein HYQ45_000771 [Verticillium longisporum]|uniref:Uncharacterized protein n=4 Tax=Verticillium TaxID=1036719 RepID=G2X6Z5_VERDV|nr:uncharacterized protein VDAG_05927 [Verticillium dahliae VdLs.17]KAF3345931.1 Putative dipeptidyl peptidase 3 [Verticillium dahliae VDG2]KAG7142854.1 hypothetical protein HYQ45_000771 [Verticillium longisporum]KAH6708174.1 hypothetical protein EV126DRAFT_408218 [Verticillium dahliae]EGY14763.1 hypothetical protein VDAG_05927 [Verticillium dahliae VdLs.17]PNH35036.1 hypothetical protein BJF96_g1641 [Verticillium dahliae]
MSPFSKFVLGLSLVTAILGAAVPVITVPATISTVTGPVSHAATDTSISCIKDWCQDGVSMCLYWGGVTSWDVSHGVIPGMTQTVFSEPCTVPAAASTAVTNVSDDDEILDSKADIEFNGLSLVTAKAVVDSTSSTVGNETTTPSTSSVLCNPTYCQDSTLYCHYWAGVTGWDVSLGLVPGMQRSSIGECESVTGSASLVDSATATATATATVTAS